MPFNPAPATWLGAGFVSSSGAHTVTLNTGDAATNKTLPLLTDVEADPATGDVRKIVLAIMQAVYSAWLVQVATNQPVNMTVTRNTSVNDETSKSTITYAVTLVCDDAVEVADEPT